MSDNIKKLLFTDATGTLYSVTLGIDGVPIDASTIAYISRDNHFSGTTIFDKTVTLNYTPQNETDATTKTYVDTQIKNCVPSGTLRMWAGKTVPDGYLLCNGQSFNILQYPDLFDVIGYTYGGSGNTANVPNLNDRTVWFTTDTNSVGTMMKDGLPNVYGTKLFWGWIVVDGGNEGALTNAGATGHPYWSDTLSDETHYSSVELNASKYNATYGASNKVQPKATQLLIIIKT